MKNLKFLLSFLSLAVAVAFLAGCWYVAAAGAGAYGGYKAKEEGYSLQNPIKKEDSKKKAEKK